MRRGRPPQRDRLCHGTGQPRAGPVRGHGPRGAPRPPRPAGRTRAGGRGRARRVPPLLAGAAAHRLLCAAAELPDPAREGEDERLPPGLPAVLLAQARPLRADYRIWLGPDRIDADRRVRTAPAETLGEALRRVSALTDARCGALPEPLPADLRQLPVPLARCAVPLDGSGTGRGASGGGSRAGAVVLVAGAARLDLARLDLFCRSAELLLGEDDFTVGATPGHARGRALRAAVLRRPAPVSTHSAVAADRWSGHPQVRHWWTTLTARLGVAARLEVFRLAPHEEVYRAVVRPTAPGTPMSPMSPTARTAPAPAPLGDAVEATPGDAAALAALAAVVRVRAATAEPSATAVRVPDGALAPLAAAGARTAAWEDTGWTGRWLADLAGREEAFQDALRRAAGAALPARGPVQPPRNAELASLLRAFGFTVLPTPREVR